MSSCGLIDSPGYFFAWFVRILAHTKEAVCKLVLLHITAIWFHSGLAVTFSYYRSALNDFFLIFCWDIKGS